MAKALQIGKEAVAKYPNDAAISSSYAMMLGENQQTDEAVRLMQSSLKGTASDRDVYLNIAQIYERGRQYTEAESSVRKAETLAKDPQENEMAFFLLGAIYEKQKQYDKAEEQFKKVVAMNPKNAPALNYYGYMLADRGIRLDEAQEMIQRALDQDPFNGAYLDSLGWVYYKENKLDEAESNLHKAVQREPNDPTIRTHLGDVYAKLGRTEQAAAEWEKALADWHKSLPSDLESDKVSELEKKLGQMKHRVAQKAPTPDAKP
jgi:tetratricopeptide (TPR) repeat protein